MITQKDKMLMLVLKDPQLQASYGFDATDYECLSDALDSSNPVVATVAKIIKELNKAGFKNIICYDPVAIEGFKNAYKLEYECDEKKENVLSKADILAITTAWPEFATIKKETYKPIVDCRYML